MTTTTLIGGLVAGRRLMNRFRASATQLESIRPTSVAREAAPSRSRRTAAFMGWAAEDEAALAALVLSR